MADEKQTSAVSSPTQGQPGTPDLVRLLGGLLSSAQKNSDPSVGQPNESTAPSAQTSAESAMGDGLSAVLSDPALLEKLPQMISVIKPLLGSVVLPTPDSATHNAPPKQNARDGLLLALKPFLSARRCEAIDTMLRINQLGTVFQQLK